MHSRAGWIGFGVLTAAALAVYVATMAPTVSTGDSGELISAAYVGGVAHPPGYPLYTMIGWAATHLWPGSPAVIMNFLSALFQALSVGLVGLLTARLIDPGWPRGRRTGAATLAGVSAGAALALSTGFWAYALVAEVFGLNDLFAVVLLLLAVEWYRDRSKVWALWALGLASGLAAAHQQTIVLLGPGLAILLVAGVRADAEQGRGRRQRDRKQRLVRPGHFVAAAALIGVGLLAYLWLPIAAGSNPPMNFGDPETLSRFRNVVSRGPYGSFSLIPGGERGSVGENLALYAEYLARSFTIVGIALAIVGSLWLWKRFRTEAAALTTAWFFAGPTFVIFAAAPLEDALTEGIVERFYILSSLIVAIAIGAGVFAAAEWALQQRRLRERTVVAAGLTAVAVLSLTLGAFRWSHVDQSGNRVAEYYGIDLLSDLEPGSLLLTRGDHNYTSLAYAQYVAGDRPDVVVLDLELLTLPSYVVEQKARHPEIVLPFEVYDRAADTLADVVAANQAARAVYIAGPVVEKDEDGSEVLHEIRAGLVRRLTLDAAADEYGILLADPSRVADLHFPDKGYPATTWEAVITRNYGQAAHSAGFAFHEPEPTEFDSFVEEMYRLSIALDGPPEAYKNLGLFYWERDGDPATIVDLWETYLSFDPDDPQVDSIRRAIAQLTAG